MAKSWSSMNAEEKIEAIKDHSNNNLKRIAQLEKEVADLKLENARILTTTKALILEIQALKAERLKV
jgi:cell division septum initiation protein DivIVA